jgi:ferredoxin, 2Fe-2S
MPKLTFLPSEAVPSGAVLDCNDGDTVFEVGRAAGIAIDTACVGSGTCGLCRVKVIEGQQHLSEYSETELKHLGNVYFLTRVRLSCQSTIRGGDVTVELATKPPRKPKRKR